MMLLSLSLTGCGGGGNNNSSESESDVSLVELNLDGATLDRTFQTGFFNYSASVAFSQKTILLTPVTSDTGATVQVNGSEVASGSASASIALVEGANTITLVVTAEDGETSQSYTIEIIRENSNTFVQQAFIKGSHIGAGSRFGRSIAISENTLVVGAPWGDAAYIFIRNGDVWSQQAYLKASDAEAYRKFGGSVAISGDTLMVGSMTDAAYVFTRSDETWEQLPRLNGSNTEAGDRFGGSVAISGDILAVGAEYEDSSPSAGEADNSKQQSGAAYIWELEEATP